MHHSAFYSAVFERNCRFSDGCNAQTSERKLNIVGMQGMSEVL